MLKFYVLLNGEREFGLKHDWDWYNKGKFQYLKILISNRDMDFNCLKYQYPVCVSGTHIEAPALPQAQTILIITQSYVFNMLFAVSLI